MHELRRIATIPPSRRRDPVANGAFGDLENRVKLGQATPDELHLWQKKISAGNRSLLLQQGDGNTGFSRARASLRADNAQ